MLWLRHRINRRLHALLAGFLASCGGTGGFRSDLGFVPERDAGVVVLVNSENDADRQGEAILEWLLHHP